MGKVYAKIDGMHCEHCESKIKNGLEKKKNIKSVSIKNNIAYIEYKSKISNKEIIDTIDDLGYVTKEEYISGNLKDIDSTINLKEFLIIGSLIILIYLMIKYIFGLNIFYMIPNIDETISFSMLFVIGILTSIHCISMCGAISLLAIYDSNRTFKKPVWYNVGRILSYTIIGGLVGALGSLFKVNDLLNGVIVITLSILMLFMSLNMIGILSFKAFRYKINNKSRNPFIIGLLNGLMPCGPLQAMEVYALSTGNFFTGALSMFLFGLGTMPLMISFGFVYNLFKGKSKVIINKISAVLILILSLFMFNRGLLSFDIDLFRINPNYSDYLSAYIDGEYQVVEFDLSVDHFEDIVVQKGIPVKMIINASKKNLTTCNNWIMIRKYDVLERLEVGKNEIVFTPKEEGEYPYTCRMNMLKNTIKVIDNKNYFKEVNNEKDNS